MLIFAIDDEPKLLRILHRAIEDAAPGAEIMDFSLGSAAVRAIEERHLRPDFVFSDIQMPGLDGLQLAARVKTLVPTAKLVFVTGYQDYALDAYQLHVTGYIMKPVTAARVKKELLYNAPELMASPDKLIVQCFGNFEAFWRGKPLAFGRRQTKELLAYLIDRGGTVCTAEEIAAVLWENESDMGAMKTRIRQLVSDLKNTLSEIGMDDALIRRRGQLGIRRDLMDCDYYRMLDGDMNAVNAFQGEYMSQYTWARLTEAKLYFRHR